MPEGFIRRGQKASWLSFGPVRIKKKAGRPKPRRGLTPDRVPPSDTLILDVQPPQLGEIGFFFLSFL